MDHDVKQRNEKSDRFQRLSAWIFILQESVGGFSPYMMSGLDQTMCSTCEKVVKRCEDIEAAATDLGTEAHV